MIEYKSNIYVGSQNEGTVYKITYHFYDFKIYLLILSQRLLYLTNTSKKQK